MITLAPEAYIGSWFGFWFLISIVVHEWGHLIMLRKSFPEATIEYIDGDICVGKDWMYEEISVDERWKVYFNGVIMGFIPLTLISLQPSKLLFIMAIILYVIGCKHDYKEMKRCSA